MKPVRVTVEISEALLRQAKEFAERNGIPLRQVIEHGLETVLRGSRPPAWRFRMKSVAAKGEGLVCEDDWGKVRSLIYEGHGG
jgi:hypothetical protein